MMKKAKSDNQKGIYQEEIDQRGSSTTHSAQQQPTKTKSAYL